MTAYYNENDPFAAAWLRELIKQGLIPDGFVDIRSICDVTGADLVGFDQVHFFAGIGGWAEALRLAGWPVDRPVWTGSPPCQPFSVAGKRQGVDDKRHLWPELFRLVGECRPSNLFGEQVAAAVGQSWLDNVANDLEGLDYAVGAAIIPACAVGAPHRRDRLFFVAHAHNSERRAKQSSRYDADRGPAGRLKSNSDATEYDPSTLADASGERRDGRAASTEFTRGLVVAPDDGALGDAASAREGRRGLYGPGQSGSPDTIGAPGQFAGSCAGALVDAQSDRRRQGRTEPEIRIGEHDASVYGLLVDADNERRQKQRGAVTIRTQQPSVERSSGNYWADAERIVGIDGKARPVKPGICLLVDGLPNRVGMLRGFGNAIVPQAAAEFIGAYMDVRAAA